MESVKSTRWLVFAVAPLLLLAVIACTTAGEFIRASKASLNEIGAQIDAVKEELANLPPSTDPEAVAKLEALLDQLEQRSDRLEKAMQEAEQNPNPDWQTVLSPFLSEALRILAAVGLSLGGVRAWRGSITSRKGKAPTDS